MVLVGFSSGLLYATNKLVQDSFHYPKSRLAGFSAAGTVYEFSDLRLFERLTLSCRAFFVAPLTYGRWCVEKLGYRVSFIVGMFRCMCYILFSAFTESLHKRPLRTGTRRNLILAVLACSHIHWPLRGQLYHWLI